MRLLYITNGYPPQRWAGTETYTASLAEGFARGGHSVGVLCAGAWDTGDRYWNGVSEDVQNDVHVRRINLNWSKSPEPFRYLYDNPVVAEYLHALLNEWKPDLVHVTSCETLSASVLRVVKENGIPLVLSLTDFWFLCPRITLLHGDGHNCSGQTTPAECLDCKLLLNTTYHRARRKYPVKKLLPVIETLGRSAVVTRLRGFRGLIGNMAERKSLLMQALSLPDTMVTASDFVREIYRGNGVTAGISVQAYGHDLAWLKEFSGKSKSPLIRFGYIGQILSAKGVHLILQAISMLPEEIRAGLSLVVYGNLEHTPVYGRHLEDLASGLPNVRFGGTYPHSESARVFSDIDVLLVPSLWYDFPLIIFEAFATKTPVIATNLGGMAESVQDGENGLLFERNHAQDLARQLIRIVREPGLLERLVKGIPPVKKIDQELEEFENIYRRYIEESVRSDG